MISENTPPLVVPYIDSTWLSGQFNRWRKWCSHHLGDPLPDKLPSNDKKEDDDKKDEDDDKKEEES